MNTIKKIGESIRILRLKKGLSQEQLALHSGVNTSYLGQVERGENNPTIQTLEKIANGLEVPVGSLMDTNNLIDSFYKDKNAILSAFTLNDLIELISDALRDKRKN